MMNDDDDVEEIAADVSRALLPLVEKAEARRRRGEDFGAAMKSGEQIIERGVAGRPSKREEVRASAERARSACRRLRALIGETVD